MNPREVRNLARQMRKRIDELDAFLSKVPSEAYQICGHTTVSDASTRSLRQLIGSLERNALKFGKTG